MFVASEERRSVEYLQAATGLRSRRGVIALDRTLSILNQAQRSIGSTTSSDIYPLVQVGGRVEPE